MKNILWIVQPSMRSYKTSKYLLLNDGPMIRTRNIIKEVLKRNDQYHFYLVLPEIELTEGMDSYDELFKDFDIDKSLISYIPMYYPFTVQLSRFHFDVKTVEERIGKIIDDIDLIINEISELTLNYRVWLQIYKHKNIPIISYTGHFSRLKENTEYCIDFYLRQIDGYLASNRYVINKHNNLNEFKDAIKCFHDGNLISKSDDIFYLWDYGLSTEELDKYKVDDKFEKTTIFFISRLSDNTRTKGKTFIEYINSLYEQNNNFQVIFANVNDAMDWDYLIKNVKPIYIYAQRRLTRKEYLELLWKSDIVPILYDTTHIFSLGEYEAKYAKNIIINDLAELEDTLDKIRLSPYRDNIDKFLESEQKNIKCESVESNVDQFLADINNLCT